MDGDQAQTSDIAHPQRIGEIGGGHFRRRAQGIEARRAGEVNPRLGLAHRDQTATRAFAGDAMKMGEFGDRVAHPIVECTLGDLAAVEVHQRHIVGHRRGRGRQHVETVTDHQYRIGIDRIEACGGRRSDSRHGARRLGGGRAGEIGAATM